MIKLKKIYVTKSLRYLLIGILFLFAPKVFSQKLLVYSNVKVGEIAPDIIFKNIDKYTKSEKKLSEFTEKLLIVDFWATWCSPCIGMMPRMDSLKKVFNKDLIFMSVTKQPKSYAQPFLNKVEKDRGQSFNIPVVYGDTVLHKLFPHTSLPHYVWLDPVNRKVIAITGAQFVTEKNIKAYLANGSTENLIFKTDKWLDYNDRDYTLLEYLSSSTNNEIKTMPKQFSSFWGYIPNLRGLMYSHLRDSINNNRFLAKNSTPLLLLTYAFGEGRRFLQTKSVILLTKETEKLTTDLSYEAYWSWQKENAVTYEISVLPQNRHLIFEMMRNDMLNYFNRYEIKIEKRMDTCLVLVSTGPNDNLKSKGGKWKVVRDQFGYRSTNQPFSDFIVNLCFYHFTDSPVLVDETKIDFNIDLDLNVSNFHDIGQLNKELSRYNLKFVKKEAMGEFLIISDKVR